MDAALHSPRHPAGRDIDRSLLLLFPTRRRDCVCAGSRSSMSSVSRFETCSERVEDPVRRRERVGGGRWRGKVEVDRNEDED